jgi:hypothetical protein
MSTSDRLTQLASSYHREAGKCLGGKAYLAACVMQVSVLEAALQSMCFLYPGQVKKTAIYQKKKFRGKRYRALEFSLKQLIDIADELGWFPSKKVSWAGKRAQLAGFVHEIREFRNYVHPGKMARERGKPTRFSKRHFDVVFEVFEVANSWLLHQVEQSLKKRMKREGLL